MKKTFHIFFSSILVLFCLVGAVQAVSPVVSYPVFLFSSADIHEVKYEYLRTLPPIDRSQIWSAPQNISSEGYVARYEVRARCFSCATENTWSGFRTVSFPVETRLITPHQLFSSFGLSEQGFNWYANNLIRFQVRAVYNDNYFGLYGQRYSRWSPVVYMRVSGQTSAVSIIQPPVVNSSTVHTGYPNITAPTLNQILTTYPRRAELRWSAVASATVYQVELACDVCSSTRTRFSAPYAFFVNDISTTTNLFAGDNEFRLRVRARFADGLYGPWSSENFFRFRTR